MGRFDDNSNEPTFRQSLAAAVGTSDSKVLAQPKPKGLSVKESKEWDTKRQEAEAGTLGEFVKLFHTKGKKKPKSKAVMSLVKTLMSGGLDDNDLLAGFEGLKDSKS